MAAPRPPLRALLVDISGTLHIGYNPTIRAVEAFRQLQASGIPYRMCSNTSKESTRDVSTRLRELGFDVHDAPASAEEGPRQVWTSVGAMRRIMDEIGVHRPYLLLSQSARQELSTLSDSDSDSDSATTPFDGVVVGLCPARLDYAHLNTAFRILACEHSAPSARAPILIAAHTARFLEAPTGGLALGPGPFVAALEHAAGVRAHVVGKPSRAFFEAVIADISVQEGGVVAIIGDDVEADLGGGARELGLWRVLVRTGKYRPGDETRTAVPPDEVVDSFATFVESLLSDETH
ncbi:HAD-like domain-containing protein [Mycena rosella]|uniref:Haloacid dehalogenase-like hydrolase domain-containing protein 2 n=1 Tax=Mycena rosella TaxID=1033263 RepID=A0AAD7DRX2_MYCRO|nr:HAD-like domain-containing protein [Mycena rosella]